MREIVLISLEVVIPGAMVDPMIKKLHRIIGVIDVTVSFGALINSAIYRLLPAALKPELCQLLNSYQARILNIYDGHLLIQQIGKEQDITHLYEALDGPSLVGFCKNPVAVSQPFNWGEVQETVDSALASVHA